ncbi:MAG TPA: oligopeptide ABC transporter permease [Herpetosiphonaceae bacterium]
MAVATPQMEGSEILEQELENPIITILRRYGRHRLAVVSTIVLSIIILMSVFAPWITSHNPTFNNPPAKNLPPSWEHLMGTDYIGRDVFSRIIHAGRVSLGIAFITVLFSDFLGIVIGVVSGYFGGWVDSLIMRIVDFMLTLPLLPILLVLITIFSPSIGLLITVLVLTGWTGSARLIRGQILSIREREFVEASRALAASKARIMFRHMVPNALAPIIVNVTLNLSGIIILEAALSYLGFGVQPPQASWGNMLQNANSLTVLERYSWQAFFPGLAIFLTSLCFNFMGDGLRDALDPRMKL